MCIICKESNVKAVGRTNGLFVTLKNANFYLQHGNKLSQNISPINHNLLFSHCFIDTKITVKIFKATGKDSKYL